MHKDGNDLFARHGMHGMRYGTMLAFLCGVAGEGAEAEVEAEAEAEAKKVK
jgi:hypothetical protein